MYVVRTTQGRFGLTISASAAGWPPFTIQCSASAWLALVPHGIAARDRPVRCKRGLGNSCADIQIQAYCTMPDKPLRWVGSSLADLRAFPDDAKRMAGYQLRRVQAGLMPDDWKALASVGSGVYEIRLHTGVEHRVCYVAK